MKQEASSAQNARIKLSMEVMEETRAWWHFAEEINDIVCSRSMMKFMLPRLQDGLFEPMMETVDKYNKEFGNLEVRDTEVMKKWLQPYLPRYANYINHTGITGTKVLMSSLLLSSFRTLL